MKHDKITVTLKIRNKRYSATYHEADLLSHEGIIEVTKSLMAELVFKLKVKGIL